MLGPSGPPLTLSRRWTSLTVGDSFLSFKEVGQGIPSFNSCPVSCVELCKDSARQPGWRPQRSVWLPLLLLRPRGLLCRHTTPRDACSSTMERQVTQLEGLGITLALAQGEWRCWRDRAPRAPMRHKGTQVPETSLWAPRGSLLDSCSHVNLDPHLLPKPALRALPWPGPHAQSLSTYLYEYQKINLKPPLIPCSRSW